MGELVIISESGVPHTAVRVQIGDGEPIWYGFRPQIRFMFLGKGMIDTSNREELAKHLVRFDVPDAQLEQALSKAITKYQNAMYILFVRDCVSFVTDFIRELGLMDALDAQNPIKGSPVFSPRNLVRNLSKRIQ